MENNKIKLYVVDIEENTISRLEELFYNHPDYGIKLIGYSHNYNSCVNDLSRAKNADVFLISAYLPDTMGTELITPLKKVNPKAKFIVTLQKTTRNLAEAALSKGADDFIQKPMKAGTLIDKIMEVVGEQTVSQETNAYEDEFDPTPSTTKQFEDTLQNPSYSPEEQYEEEEVDAPQQSRRALFDAYSENTITSSIYTDEDKYDGDKPNTVCVFSSTGSNGKTTMLVNSAISIHNNSEYKPKICILDFNMLYPSVQIKFHNDDLIHCKKSVFDLLEDINSLNETLINEALITHEPTGIKILNTPSDSVRDLSSINKDSIITLITHLREMFDLILIDTSTNIRDNMSSFPLIVADKGIVLLEPDLSNLLQTRKFISLMKIFENDSPEKITPKFQFVLNKENQKTIIHVDTIKKTLFNTDVRLTIPEDANITHLSNNGFFAVESNTPSARSIKELGRTIYPYEKELSLTKKPKKSKGFLGNLFKKE